MLALASLGASLTALEEVIKLGRVVEGLIKIRNDDILNPGAVGWKAWLARVNAGLVNSKAEVLNNGNKQVCDVLAAFLAWFNRRNSIVVSLDRLGDKGMGRTRGSHIVWVKRA